MPPLHYCPKKSFFDKLKPHQQSIFHVEYRKKRIMEYTVGGRARDAEICLHLLGADDGVRFQDQGYSLRFAGFGLSPSHRIAMGIFLRFARFGK